MYSPYEHQKGKSKGSHIKELRVLLDSGCSGTMINKKFLKKLPIKTSSAQSWNKKSGMFNTAGKCKVAFTLPEFHEHKEIEWNVHVDQSDHNSSTYDMIIGRDLLGTLGMDLCFSDNMIKWDEATIPMRNPKIFHPEIRKLISMKVFTLQIPSQQKLREFNISLTSNTLQLTWTRSVKSQQL